MCCCCYALVQFFLRPLNVETHEDFKDFRFSHFPTDIRIFTRYFFRLSVSFARSVLAYLLVF